jgi:hypothetical protein
LVNFFIIKIWFVCWFQALVCLCVS